MPPGVRDRTRRRAESAVSERACAAAPRRSSLTTHSAPAPQFSAWRPAASLRGPSKRSNGHLVTQDSYQRLLVLLTAFLSPHARQIPRTEVPEPPKAKRLEPGSHSAITGGPHAPEGAIPRILNLSTYQPAAVGAHPITRPIAVRGYAHNFTPSLSFTSTRVLASSRDHQRLKHGSSWNMRTNGLSASVKFLLTVPPNQPLKCCEHRAWLAGRLRLI